MGWLEKPHRFRRFRGGTWLWEANDLSKLCMVWNLLCNHPMLVLFLASNFKSFDGNRSPVKTNMETPKIGDMVTVLSVFFYSISFWTMKFYAQVPHGYGYQGADRHLNHRLSLSLEWPELSWISFYREPKPKNLPLRSQTSPKSPSQQNRAPRRFSVDCPIWSFPLSFGTLHPPQ